jgi:hypothetical protein
MATDNPTAVELRQMREANVYRMIAGLLMGALICFGLLQLYGVIRV